MIRYLRSLACASAFACLLVSLPSESVWGQIVARQGRAGEEAMDIFLPAPRNLRQQLSRAAKALEEGQLSEAVDLLGQLLASAGTDPQGADPGAEQDYFLSESEAGGTQTSLKSEAQRMLGAMPDKGRELYELKFGADARQMLERALETRDFTQLVEVTRRYFHTSAGYEATMLIGRYYLDQGRPLAAALRFERLVGSRQAVQQYEPELSVLLATCWLMSGMPDRARATLVELKSSAPQAAFRIGDTQVSLFQDEEQALTWLEQLVGPLLNSEREEATEWVLFRGNAARNAESRGGFPLLTARWRVRAANHPTDEETIAQQRNSFRDQGIPAIPTLQPLVVSDVVVIRTPRQLMAVDMQSGKRIWHFPWFEETEEDPLPSDQFRPDGRVPDPYALELTQRVWDDAPYGQISSDGQQVFLLWRLTSNLQELSTRVLALGRQSPDGLGETNQLVALDLGAQGKLRWIVGDVDGTDEPQLAGAFFLGAPLPLMGQLYVLAEINSEIRLVVLDAATGQLQWAQQLAHVDQREIMNDPTRRAAGASPSFSDGVLVCPTSAGAVVAVDIATRSLLWGYQYAHAATVRRTGFSIYPTPVREFGKRWLDATVTIADGRVLVTPVESDQLHCLDLVTGKPVWDPQPRNGLLYTACVVDGQAVMVGADRVQAIALADGSVTWTQPLPQGLPSGRGIRTGDAYYLPTTASQLLRFELATGNIVSEVETSLPLGNLVAYKDQLVSQNVDWLAAYYQTEPLRADVARRLEADPDDIWALTRRAELLLYDGVHGEAVEVLRHAYRLAPQDDAIRASLVQALMSAMRSGFQANRQLAAELETLIDQPAQRAEFYRLMAVGLRAAGALDESAEFFLKLASLDGTGSGLADDSDRPDMVRVDADLRVRRDRWIAVNVGEMLAHADAAVKQRIDAVVTTRFAELSQRSSVRELRQFVNYFGRHPLGEHAQLQLARLLLDQEQPLNAELCLIPLQESRDPAIAAQATAWLAELLRAHLRLPEAGDCYKRLARQWADVPVRDGQTGQQVAAEALADPALQEALSPSLRWPYGKVTAAEAERNMFPAYASMFGIELTDVGGPFPADVSLVYNRQQNLVVFRDGFGNPTTQVQVGDGNQLILPNVNVPAGAAAAEGHLVILCVGGDVMAIDALYDASARDDVVLWRQDVSSGLASSGTMQASANAIVRPWGPTRYVFSENLRPMGSIGPITAAGFFYQKLQELICADPLTGETIWARGGMPAGSDLFGDDEYLFLAPPDHDEAIVLNAADGTMLERRFVGTRRDRWITSGRCVLHCQLVDQQLIVRWFDAWAEQDVWQRKFSAGAQCALVGREALAVLETSGQFTLLTLADGAERFTAQLDAEPQLARLHIIPSRDTCLVLASRLEPQEDASMARVRSWSPLGSDLCPEINGRIYALDMHTGKPLWPAAAEVARLCCPLDQPPESPAVAFFQNIQPPSPDSAPRAAIRGSLLCMDKRDGRQLLYDNDLPMVRSYSISLLPQEHKMLISAGAKQHVLAFTDEPVAQQPPLQFKPAPPKPDALQQVGKIARGILQAIARPKEPGEEGVQEEAQGDIEEDTEEDIESQAEDQKE